MLSDDAARDAIIVALDCDRETALDLARRLEGRARWVKVGMTLFYAEGPSIVGALSARGLKVFLDLKLHDIPFQVRGAARAASLTGADLLSIHGAGGSAMVREARAGVEEAAVKRDGRRTRLLAISVLTSMGPDALAEVGVEAPVAEQVDRLARLSVSAGSDGVVCSPQEAARLRELLGPQALIVTPGVRPLGAAVGDQRRVATPAAAIGAGASKLVIGRPITQAPDVVRAFESVFEELEGPLSDASA
ncbi:orotidine-5'-phosphate decarboxylase [Olsenella sp. HMSC062G07]|uniref:orotidine-5'-phosphate decarboxylase n=1 Tax=Olsenella sp. HMSC062G07 TaxID=1739330 RepID=UPI0008A3B44B|nr:orotidine-5'-phosphate decarboxylase [Olsenella sp. HMSC062G07]OFK24631.1 orotidine 5'-phosphate decarboxylase [Olsenella sp. HMSC062G07]